MPIGPWSNWDEAIEALMEEGYSREEAERIAGAMEQESKSDKGDPESLLNSVINGAEHVITDLGLKLVSVVETPAQPSDWITMKSDEDEFDWKSEGPVLIKKNDDEDEQKALAPALVPNIVDKQGDVIPTYLVEKAAHNWLKDKGGVDTDHNMLEGKGKPVESWTLNEEKTFEMVDGTKKTYPSGTWMLMIEFGDETWDRIKSGELEGLSIYGKSKRLKLSKEYIDKTIESMKEEGYLCECLDCGFLLLSEKHCDEIECPVCGGEMRRFDRPGEGKQDNTVILNDPDISGSEEERWDPRDKEDYSSDELYYDAHLVWFKENPQGTDDVALEICREEEGELIINYEALNSAHDLAGHIDKLTDEQVEDVREKLINLREEYFPDRENLNKSDSDLELINKEKDNINVGDNSMKEKQFDTIVEKLDDITEHFETSKENDSEETETKEDVSDIEDIADAIDYIDKNFPDEIASTIIDTIRAADEDDEDDEDENDEEKDEEKEEEPEESKEEEVEEEVDEEKTEEDVGEPKEKGYDGEETRKSMIDEKETKKSYRKSRSFKNATKEYVRDGE